MSDPADSSSPAPAAAAKRVRVRGSTAKPTPVTAFPAAEETGPCTLDVSDAEIVIRPADGKQFYRFPQLGMPVENQKNRPGFYWEPDEMVDYTGPGWTKDLRKNHQQIHPVLQEPLTKMMTALVQEGARINDEGMKTAVIGSAWRSFEKDGQKFLAELKKQIRKHPKDFPFAFPSACEKEAASNLRDDGPYNLFIAHLGAPPWTPEMARDLMQRARQAKAPGGRSTHESGLTVDINFHFQYRDPKSQATSFQQHDMTTEYNSDARLSATGKWLERYARRFHFSSYNTSAEIWHMEYLKWEGTDADPHKR